MFDANLRPKNQVLFVNSAAVFYLLAKQIFLLSQNCPWLKIWTSMMKTIFCIIYCFHLEQPDQKILIFNKSYQIFYQKLL